MTAYQLQEWATRPFPRTYSKIVGANLVDPQQASQGAVDLLGFDTDANLGRIYASVREGRLDDGTIVQGGPHQIGDPIIGDSDWTHIVGGPLGRGRAKVLFYSASEGVGAFFGVQKNGNLELIKRHAGWRTSWTHILAGNFIKDPRVAIDGGPITRPGVITVPGPILNELLFYDAAAGEGEFYSVGEDGSITLIKTLSGWRGSWHTILKGNFSDGDFDDLLFYDKSVGHGEFYRNNGKGGIEQLSLYTNWRTSWDQVRAGAFELNGRYSGLIFHEEGSGYSEIYKTDGHGKVAQLDVDFGAAWLARRANFQTVLADTFIGNGVGLLDDICAYDPSTGAISMFRYVPVN